MHRSRNKKNKHRQRQFSARTQLRLPFSDFTYPDSHLSGSVFRHYSSSFPSDSVLPYPRRRRRFDGFLRPSSVHVKSVLPESSIDSIRSEEVRRHQVCESRKTRREVLFADHRVGRGVRVSPVRLFTEDSKVRCRRK